MRLNWPFFVLLDGLGAAIWTGSTIGLGMLLHQEIGRLVAPLQELEPIAIGSIATLLAGYISIKWWQRHRFYYRLRMARITVDELHKLMAEGQRPVIVDLRASLVRDQDSRIIPGALVADVADVEQWRDQMPTDREIIFYCTCPNESGAANVARQLIDLGYARVRPLLGGLDAWVAAGYEVATGPVAVAGQGSIPAFPRTVLRGTGAIQPAAIGVR
jgi:rhodanese-related sulfurtransferase